MSQTLQNQLLLCKSMNGIISFDDGAGSTISNGQIISNDISGNSITTNSFSTTDLILPRKSTPALNTLLGSTIDLDLLIQNLRYDTVVRNFEVWNDSATGQITEVDTANSNVNFNTNIFNAVGFTSLSLASGNLQFITSTVSFPNSFVSFNSNLPTSTLTPTTGNQLITKTYADTTYAVAGAYATLGGNNAFTGTNTFNTNLPTSTLAATSNNQFITKIFGDVSYGRLLSANNWGSTNTFDTSLPTSSVISSTSGTQFITRNIADGRFGQLAAANAWTSTNTFNSNLPTSTVASSSSGTQFITRNIGDARFGQLAVANTWSLTNTFSNGIIPRRSAGTGTDLQISNNAMQFRQATSVNNIGIGLSTLIGDSVLAGQIYNTGEKNIAIGNFALEKMDGGSSCIAIGFQSMQNVSQQRIYGAGIFPSRCIAIGETTLRSNLYGNDNIAIGHNALTNVSSGNSNICMGTNCGNGLSFQGECVFIGSGCAPSVVDNAITAIGAQALGGASGQFNSGVAIGFQSFYFNNNASANTGVGAMSGFANQSGQANTCLGCFSGRFNTANNFNSTTTIGYCSSAEADREFVIGGNGVQGDTQFLTLPWKTRLACNQSPIGVTINLSFRTNENVMITDATTTTINLPTPTANSIGTKFHIIRVVATSNITVNAPAGQTIGLYQPNGAYITNASFVWTYASGSIGVLCINSTAGGTNWILLPPSISEGTNSLLSSTTIPSPSLNYSISFGGQTTTGYHPYYMDNTNMNYQPSTQILTTTNQTITGSVVYKKYYLSMVNPTILTGSTPLIMAPPLYEYTRVNLASGVIQLPLSSDVEIGTVLRFRRITTMTGAINLEIQTGSGQSILGRNSITTATNVPFLAASVTYGSVVFLSSNIWAVND